MVPGRHPAPSAGGLHRVDHLGADDAREPALGAGVSYYVMLQGIVQHDLYHAGQIRLLARALE